MLKTFPERSEADKQANKIVFEADRLYKFLKKSNEDLMNKEIGQIDIKAQLMQRNKYRASILRLIEALDANAVSKDVLETLQLALRNTDRENIRTKDIVSTKLDIHSNMVQSFEKIRMQETIYSPNKHIQDKRAIDSNTVKKQV